MLKVLDDVTRAFIFFYLLMFCQFFSAIILRSLIVSSSAFQVPIEDINDRLEAYVSTLPNNVAYLDLSRRFASRSGEVNEALYSDGVHPTDKGYWVTIFISTHLTSTYIDAILQ